MTANNPHPTERRGRSRARPINVAKLAQQHSAEAVDRLMVLARSENHCVAIAAVTLLMKLGHGSVFGGSPARAKPPRGEHLKVTIRKFKEGNDAK